MKTTLYSGIIFLILTTIIFTGCSKDDGGDDLSLPVSTSITLFDNILFYDGYDATVSTPVPDIV